VSGRHQPENGADSPQAIEGYVNPDGSGEGNWSADITDPEHSGIAILLDSLESLLIGIRQRRMGRGQLERYARLLNEAGVDAIEKAREYNRGK
jgi:hypothetical protein